MEGVTGSIPVPPTNKPAGLRDRHALYPPPGGASARPFVPLVVGRVQIPYGHGGRGVKLISTRWFEPAVAFHWAALVSAAVG